jgi:hypothetical protein
MSMGTGDTVMRSGRQQELSSPPFIIFKGKMIDLNFGLLQITQGCGVGVPALREPLTRLGNRIRSPNEVNYQAPSRTYIGGQGLFKKVHKRLWPPAGDEFVGWYCKCKVPTSLVVIMNLCPWILLRGFIDSALRHYRGLLQSEVAYQSITSRLEWKCFLNFPSICWCQVDLLRRVKTGQDSENACAQDRRSFM